MSRADLGALVLRAVSAIVALGGCGSSAVATTPVHFAGTDTPPLLVEGLADCRPEQPDRVELRPDEPLVVIVHGCFSSGGAFRSLAEVFELHGQQTLCFNYDDRDGLRHTARRLRGALDAVSGPMTERELVVLGHSQGGMIARIALSSIEPESPVPEAKYRLVTVSAPLAGIDAASHCGLTWLHWVSLGITTAVCQAITGSNWTEIHPYSSYWTDPEPLVEGVVEHLTVVTEEEGTCRLRDEDGECTEDDFVFTVPEQRNGRMLGDARTGEVLVRAGHAAIVGQLGRTRPAELIAILQEHRIMAATPPDRRAELERLLRRLF